MNAIAISSLSLSHWISSMIFDPNRMNHFDLNRMNNFILKTFHCSKNANNCQNNNRMSSWILIATSVVAVSRSVLVKTYNKFLIQMGVFFCINVKLLVIYQWRPESAPRQRTKIKIREKKCGINIKSAIIVHSNLKQYEHHNQLVSQLAQKYALQPEYKMFINFDDNFITVHQFLFRWLMKLMIKCDNSAAKWLKRPISLMNTWH